MTAAIPLPDGDFALATFDDSLRLWRLDHGLAGIVVDDDEDPVEALTGQHMNAVVNPSDLELADFRARDARLADGLGWLRAIRAEYADLVERLTAAGEIDDWFTSWDDSAHAEALAASKQTLDELAKLYPQTTI